MRLSSFLRPGRWCAAGVKEYWIVLAEKQRVEVNRRPEAGEYREPRIYSDAVPTIRVALPALFA